MKYTLTIEADNPEELREVTEKLTGRADTPSAVTEPTPTITETPVVEETKSDDTEPQVDVDGMPYDPEIHSTPASTKADGTWKVRKGKADEAKAAQQAFKAQGGNITPPVIEETREVPTGLPQAETKAAPSLPGSENIPVNEPVNIETLFEKATELFQAQSIDANGLGDIYEKHVGTRDAAKATELFGTNETARANAYADLVAIETDEHS